MEEYRNKVINLHAIQSQTISKFTGDIGRKTGKSTSETDRIRSGGPSGPGAPGITRKRAARRGAGRRPRPTPLPSRYWNRPQGWPRGHSQVLVRRQTVGLWTLRRAGPEAREKRQERKTTATPLRLPVDFSDFLGIYTESLVKMILW